MRVVAELGQDPGAEDGAQAGLAGVDVSVLMLAEMAGHHLGEVVDLGVQRREPLSLSGTWTISWSADSIGVMSTDDSGRPGGPVLQNGPERVVLQLSQGALNNGYIIVANPLKEGFFPKSALGPANKKDGEGRRLTLYFAGLPEPVKTDIAGKHQCFRSRGRCRAFFEHHHLAAGDMIAIEKRSEDEYIISPL